MSVTVDIATEATPDLVETIGRILPQLSKSSPAPTTAEIAEIIDSPASDLLVARVDVCTGTGGGTRRGGRGWQGRAASGCCRHL